MTRAIRGGDDRNGDLNTDNGLSDVVLCTEGEELVGRAGGEKNTTPGLMSAMSRLPTKAAATDDGVFAFPKRNAVTNASQRGTTHRHGQNAPTARLQRLVHRAKARSAQFSHTAQNGEDGDGRDEDTVPEKLKQSGLGVAMELALVGDCGVEAGVCLWECVPVEQTARGGSCGPWYPKPGYRPRRKVFDGHEPGRVAELAVLASPRRELRAGAGRRRRFRREVRTRAAFAARQHAASVPPGSRNRSRATSGDGVQTETRRHREPGARGGDKQGR